MPPVVGDGRQGAGPSWTSDSAELVFIENVGNLVCPSTYDLGEDVRMVLLSTTEGDDKPMKYPAIFHEASLAVLNKMDLLPYLTYDVEKVEKEIRVLNPDSEILRLSAIDGRGDGRLDRVDSREAPREEEHVA